MSLCYAIYDQISPQRAYNRVIGRKYLYLLRLNALYDIISIRVIRWYYLVMNKLVAINTNNCMHLYSISLSGVSMIRYSYLYHSLSIHTQSY